MKSGFDKVDTDPIFATSVYEFDALIKSGFFQVLGYTSLRVAEYLSRINTASNGEVDAAARKDLERWEVFAFHVPGTAYGAKIEWRGAQAVPGKPGGVINAGMFISVKR